MPTAAPWQISPELLDDLDERWWSVPVAEQALVFAAYRAALPRAEQGTAFHADRVSRGVDGAAPSEPRPDRLELIETRLPPSD
jgi:hypothetical protein